MGEVKPKEMIFLPANDFYTLVIKVTNECYMLLRGLALFGEGSTMRVGFFFSFFFVLRHIILGKELFVFSKRKLRFDDSPFFIVSYSTTL